MAYDIRPLLSLVRYLHDQASCATARKGGLDLQHARGVLKDAGTALQREPLASVGCIAALKVAASWYK